MGNRKEVFRDKMSLNEVLRKYKNGFRKIAFEGFEAVSVIGGSYKYNKLAENSSVDQVYGMLINAAKDEFRAAYGIPGGIRLPKKKAADRGKLFKEIEHGFEEYLHNIKETTGELTTTAFKDKITSGHFKGKTVQEIEFEVINTLFVEDLKGQAAADSIAWIVDNQYFKMITRLLSEGYSQGVVAPNMGNLFEGIATNLMSQRVQDAKKEFENFVDKKLKERYSISEIGQTGAQKVIPSYIAKSGVEVSLVPVTGTRDAYIIIETRKGAKEFGITIKLAQEVSKVKYKSSSNQEGSPFVNIARWSDALKTYTFWLIRETRQSEIKETKLLLAASLASLAVGGYSSERALVGLVSAAGGPSIRSLDNILIDIRKSNKLTMDNLKINKQEDYTKNKEKFASVLDDEAKPSSNYINKTYSLTRKVNLSFNLNTYVRK